MKPRVIVLLASVLALAVVAPAVPAIAAFSPDTGIVAGFTDANLLSLTGTAAASVTASAAEAVLVAPDTVSVAVKLWTPFVSVVVG